jgi:hypothetical protein
MFLPLELTLRPSRIYLAVLTMAHGLALAGIWLAALPLWIRALMTVALAAGALRLWRESTNNVRGLRVSQSGQIEVLDSEWQPANVLGRPVVLPWFVSLLLEPEVGETRTLILWPDSADKDILRKLRVWLRWGYTGLGVKRPRL